MQNPRIKKNQTSAMMVRYKFCWNKHHLKKIIPIRLSYHNMIKPFLVIEISFHL